MTIYNRLERQDSFPFNPQPLEILLTPNGQYLQLSLHEFIALSVVCKCGMKMAAPLSPHFFCQCLFQKYLEQRNRKKRSTNVENFKTELMRKDLLYYLTLPRLIFSALIPSALFSHISNTLREKSSPNYFLKAAS